MEKLTLNSATEKFTLQYQLSNGAWGDCKSDEETNELIQVCATYHNISVEKTIEALRAHKIMRSAPNDWYANVRAMPIKKSTTKKTTEQKIDTQLARCKHCGQTGHNGQYPFTTLPGVCDDCV